ncbi:MAG: hypothetical protein H0X29_00010 [Parachlamydiaceae bacterium]|nr:hypothetical protein [Parachlamydiaceae bacterium]
MKNFIGIILALTSVSNIHSDEADREITLSSNSKDTFIDVIECLSDSSSNLFLIEANSNPKLITLEIAVNENKILVKSSRQQSTNRNYNIPVTQSEKDDLAYITTTLARNSLPSLATSKSSLKKAGDRIDHLHPLRFLMIIFTDEELKANISALRSRGWVWDKFYSGLEGSLKEESRKNNMNNEFIVDFANCVGINVTLIQGAIQEKRWKEFVNTLIDTVPRSGNPTRYDM